MKGTSLKRAKLEWGRAGKSFVAASTLLDHELYEDAVSRAYYAVLHAAKAALATQEIFPATHAGVRQMVGFHLVKTGLIEPEYGRILAAEQDDRERSDYDVEASVKSDDARESIADAERFLARIAAYLRSVGIRGARSLVRPDPIRDARGLLKGRGSLTEALLRERAAERARESRR